MRIGIALADAGLQVLCDRHIVVAPLQLDVHPLGNACAHRVGTSKGESSCPTLAEALPRRSAFTVVVARAILLREQRFGPPYGTSVHCRR